MGLRRTVVIRLEVLKNTVEARLAQREGNELNHLDRWMEDYERYSGPVDYYYDSGSEEGLWRLIETLWKEIQPAERISS